ncbi:MAG: transcription antitermination factor NusB [Verrucomicrobiales bacterium]
MGKRREAREAALQFLFGHDLNDELALEEKEAFWELRPAADAVMSFSSELIAGVLERRGEIDACLKAASENWELGRISAVDRNILRVAIYEIHYRDDIPPAVSINEAIEIAKRFGAENSGRFVNGILDRIRKDLEKTSTG